MRTGVAEASTDPEQAMTHHSDAACASCRFYDENATNGGQAAGDEGLCRFNPPISQPGPSGHGLWPVVGGGDWCGHFAADRAPTA